MQTLLKIKLIYYFLQLHYFVRFQPDILAKDLNPLITQSYQFDNTITVL